VLIAGAVVVDDQITKAIAEHRGLVATNSAYALGVAGGPAPLLIGIALVVLGAFLALAVLAAPVIGVPPFVTALITGGLLSNTFDRVRLGAARDFLTTPWAIVNLADIAVAVGIVAFVVTATWHMSARLGPRRRAIASPRSTR
jgi:lipoprotein signal peptidase